MLTKEKRQVLINLISLTAVKALEYLIPLITIPFLINTMGIEKFGLVNYALALSMYFLAIIQYGFSFSAVRSLALNKNSAASLQLIYSATLFTTIFLIIVCLILYLFIVFSVPSFHQHLKLYLFTFASIAIQALIPAWFFQGIENIKQYAVISAFYKLIYLVLLISIINSPEDYYLVPALNSVTLLFCALTCYLYIYKKYNIRYHYPGLKNVKKTLADGFNLFVSQIAPNLYNNSATFLLGAFSSISAVGVYTAALRIIETFSAIGSILSSIFFPVLVRKQHLITKFQLGMITIGLTLTSACYIFANLISTYLFAINSAEISKTTQLLSIGILGAFGIFTYINNGLMVLNKDISVKTITTITSCIVFLFGLAAIPLWGIYGAIMMLLGGRLTMALWGFFIFKIYSKEKFE